MTVVPLHNHSEYSALDGWSRPSEIAERVSQMGCSCCGLTDHGVVSGHLEFDKELRKRDIKPIFGCELYHGRKWSNFKGKERDQAHLIVLAETDEGLRNLWRLIDATAHEDKFRYVGRVSNDDLAKNSSGLIVTSACALGAVPQGIMKDDYEMFNFYAETFRDKFYIELSTYPADVSFNDVDDPDLTLNTQVFNEALVQIGLERGFEFVYGDDGHYAFPDQWILHDAYLVASTGKATKDRAAQTIYSDYSERAMWHPEGAVCIKDEETVRKNLSYLPESVVENAIANSNKIGEICNASLPSVERHLPVFFPKECPWLAKYDIESDDATMVFIELVERGIVHRYGKDASDEVWNRAIHEMTTFIESGLEHYFLVSWDEMEFANDPGHYWNLVGDDSMDPNLIEKGPGRGSSAGCIVAYALGITDVDPLHYGLIFERFWNAGRAKGFPDIDSDFAKSRRKDIHKYLTYRWGYDRVRSIGSIIHMKPKSAIDKLWCACDVTFEEAEALKKIVGETTDIEILGPDQIGWSREIEPGKVYYVEEDVGDKIEKWISDQPDERQGILENFIFILKNACNRVANYGVHASGIVISNVDLEDQLPCYLRGSKDDRVAATMFPMDMVDKLMFVKLDVLGLKTLDTLDDWHQQMIENHDIDIDWSGLDLEDHPLEMWQLLWEGYCAGIFQVETGLPVSLCKELKPRSLDDLSSIIALNRPGPIRSGAPESFIVRRNGGTDDKFDGRKIPLLKEILEPTYGWFLYQEQVIEFFNRMNYTLSESDAVRKILGKKQPEKWDALKRGTDEWVNRGYDEMASASGLDPKDSEKIWDMLIEFGKYSYNKSHSIAYAVIAFRTLFAKYYGSTEFYIACIRTVEQNKRAKMTPLYINEAKRKKIKVLPPDIRYSKAQTSAHNGDVLFGFSDIKGVSGSGQYVVELRDEHNLDISSAERFQDQLVELADKFAQEKKRLEKEGNPLGREVKSPKQKLQVNKINSLVRAGCWDNLDQRPDMTLREKQDCEKELLEVILTDDTDQILANNFDIISECNSYQEAQTEWDEEDISYLVPGTIIEIKETFTKAKNESMGIVTIEYHGDTLEFVVFHKQWINHKFLFKDRNVGIFKLKRTIRGMNFEEGKLLR